MACYRYAWAGVASESRGVRRGGYGNHVGAEHLARELLDRFRLLRRVRIEHLVRGQGLGVRTTTLQKCAVVPRRGRI